MKNLLIRMILVFLTSFSVLGGADLCLANSKGIEHFSPSDLEKEARSVWPVIKTIAMLVAVAISILIITKGSLALGITSFVVMLLMLVMGSKFLS